MKVVRIPKIKGYRVFRDFVWPADLESFGRFNVIYGWNGSGKTTLASLLRQVESKSPIREGDTEFEFDKGRVSGRDLDTAQLPAIRVFNRESVALSIFAAGREIDPIFYFGEESVEKRKEVDKLKKELERADSDVAKKRALKNEAERDREKICEDGARLIKELLRGTGASRYNNYDKRAFKQTLEKLTQSAAQSALLSDSEKIRIKKQLGERAKQAVARVAAPLASFENLHAETAKLLSTQVASQVIDELASDSDVAAWVHRGLQLHAGTHATADCRFCGQALSEARRSRLEGHFNDAFAAFQRDISNLIRRIEKERLAFTEIDYPDAIRLYDNLGGDLEKSASIVKPMVDECAAFLAALLDALSRRQNAPFQELSLDQELGGRKSPDRERLEEAFATINAVVDKHNAITKDFEAQVEQARSGLEECYVAERFEEHRLANESVASAVSALEAAQQRPGTLRMRIAAIERDIVEHRRPADELNKELRSYLGRDELSLDVKESGYTLMRDGEPASNLSEGEKTAIAFLYFLKSLGDKSFNLKQGVVVIDDPVSSLDSNALFSAFGYMKERTKDAGQLIVLTHNFAFFRQVRNWYRNMPGQRKKEIRLRPARFFMLAARGSGASRAARLTVIDRLLSEFDSEYHYLFNRISEQAELNQDDAALEDYYAIPNMARRLLETFLAFRYPDTPGDLSKKMERVDFDDGKKTRILRFLHTYSHAGAITDSEHDPSELSEVAPVLRDLLDMMKACDSTHFEGMAKLTTTIEENGN